MKSSNVRWYGPQVTRAVRELMKRRLEAAGLVLLDQVRRNISTQGPPASAPGEFPHKVSGELERSVQLRFDRRSLSLEVFADAPHAAAVEEKRPFLRKTMLQIRPQLRAILLGSSGGTGRFKFTE